MVRTVSSLLLAVALLFVEFAHAEYVEVQAILGDSAVLSVGGARQLLRPGESHDGVTLVRTTETTAIVRIDGKTHTVALSRRVGTTYEKPRQKIVTIPRNSRNQYLTTAMINGRSTQVLVDTGANVVAMSANTARNLGIDDSTGVKASVETAGGVLDARQVTLDSVAVGDIRIDRVDATVVQGEHPAIVLLGMSYLRHVKIEEQNGILSLSRVE